PAPRLGREPARTGDPRKREAVDGHAPNLLPACRLAVDHREHVDVDALRGERLREHVDVGADPSPSGLRWKLLRDEQNPHRAIAAGPSRPAARTIASTVRCAN